MGGTLATAGGFAGLVVSLVAEVIGAFAGNDGGLRGGLDGDLTAIEGAPPTARASEAEPSPNFVVGGRSGGREMGIARCQTDG